MSNTDDQSNKYPTQAHGSIPAFHNVEEEATFFDTHDFSDFWNELRPAEIRRTYSENVHIRLDNTMNRELDELAQKAGMKKATLARQWLRERLEEEYKHLEEERKRQAS